MNQGCCLSYGIDLTIMTFSGPIRDCGNSVEISQ